MTTSYKYGHFNEDGTEFTVTNPATPRPFDNLMWNDAIFSNAHQTGVGYADYQIDGTEGVQLYTGIGRICDFDVFGRDHLMNRLIYVRDNDTGQFWNVNWEPVKAAYDSYECVHGAGYTIIRTTVNGIASEFRLFIPGGRDPVEIWTLKMKDVSGIGRGRNLSVFLYNQFQFKFKWGFDSYGDMIYRTVWLDAAANAVVAQKHPHRRPHNYLTAYMTSQLPIAAYDGSRDAFIGRYNGLHNPEAVVKGCCSNTPGSADATVGAVQFNLSLEPSGSLTWDVLIGATDDPASIPQMKNRYLDRTDRWFEELRSSKKTLLSRNKVETPDPQFDRILNTWVKQATLYGSTWCRWGWNGYRDIVQHGFGVASLVPERTRAILLEALSYQYGSGLAVRGWNPLDEKPYSDSALWLVFTLVAYLKETGDFGILHETVPFHDGASAAVLEHIERALDFLETNKGTHGLCLIKYGDWNDSLTAIGKEGRGESVWLSMAYAEAVRQMAELSSRLGDSEKEASYSSRRALIVVAINKHAWDGNWYTRCFDDSGRPVGSRSSKYAKIFMEPQCWALIAGLADDSRSEAILSSCEEWLGTDVGYLLLAPSFREIDNNIGRISSMEPGIAENGTIYSHLNIWMVMGLLKYGMADKAYELFRRVTPGYTGEALDVKQECPPYMVANCYFGPEHKNNPYQMEFTWITGSVAWFNHVLLNHMLGAAADWDALVIAPCMPSHWEICRVERSFRGDLYRITILNPDHLESGDVELTVDGVPAAGNRIPPIGDGGVHEVTARMKRKSPEADQAASAR